MTSLKTAAKETTHPADHLAFSPVGALFLVFSASTFLLQIAFLSCCFRFWHIFGCLLAFGVFTFRLSACYCANCVLVF